MTDKPQDPDPSGRSEGPPLADQIRAKLDEYEVDRHLAELATAFEDAVRRGLQMAGALAHEHRGDIERLVDKVTSAVDSRTDGRHAETIQQVRGSLERGVERIADQREGGTPRDPGAGPSNDG